VSAPARVLELTTEHGTAVAHVHPATVAPAGLVVLGHGAGGGVHAPDLAALAAALPGLGWTVVLVEQPYRAAGRRVACRTALATGAAGVVCLAFPTRPPGRPDRPSRLPELEGAGVPTLVVQGATDPYGVPPAGPGRDVVVVAGDHGLKKDVPAVVAAVTAWLAGLPGVR